MGIASFSLFFTIPFALIIFFLFVFLCIKKRNYKYFPHITVGLLLFQNLSIGLGSHFGNNSCQLLSVVTQIPSIFILVAFIFSYINNKTVTRLDFLFFILAALCLFFLYEGESNSFASLTYLRNFLIFYMAFELGRVCLKKYSDFNGFLDFYIKLSIVAFIFGLVGFLCGKNFYHATGVLEVYNAKFYSAYRDGLPGNFRTLFFGFWVNRFASLYYDPVNFSYFMSLSVFVAYIRKRLFYMALFLLGEFLTFGKGGMFIVLFTSLCVLSHFILHRFNAKVVRGFVLFLFLLLFVLAVIFIQKYFQFDFGTYNHFYGMLSGLMSTLESPLGHGLGTAGNLIKTAQVNNQEISETGLVNMAYQIGIIGATLFSFIFLATGKRAFRWFIRTNDICYLICSYFSIVTLALSVFQENTYGPQCIVPYMLLVGASNNYYRCKNNS